MKNNTIKITDFPEICNHSEHNPPSNMVYNPGIYEHICPKCGHITTFTVPRISY